MPGPRLPRRIRASGATWPLGHATAMSPPGPGAMGSSTKSWPTTVAPRRSECLGAVGAKHLCGRHWRPCLLTKVTGTCPRNAMRPNRLQCGDIAAHTALLVIGPDMCWRGGRIRCWKLTSPRRPNRWPYIAMNSPASYTTTMRSQFLLQRHHRAGAGGARRDHLRVLARRDDQFHQVGRHVDRKCAAARVRVYPGTDGEVGGTVVEDFGDMAGHAVDSVRTI